MLLLWNKFRSRLHNNGKSVGASTQTVENCFFCVLVGQILEFTVELSSTVELGVLCITHLSILYEI